ncbi:hypothetical protein GX51_03180 [Blastomyces parvus]|uniref:Uncharacterized protein n=1 Tax=Blastomyces parvus TaxID=2060905 RepID=A0A2B7X8M5_9EURO|nr:hypothetical protein GX51_03180 [Blastomyces parvus]
MKQASLFSPKRLGFVGQVHDHNASVSLHVGLRVLRSPPTAINLPLGIQSFRDLGFQGLNPVKRPQMAVSPEQPGALPFSTLDLELGRPLRSWNWNSPGTVASSAHSIVRHLLRQQRSSLTFGLFFSSIPLACIESSSESGHRCEALSPATIA